MAWPPAAARRTALLAVALVLLTAPAASAQTFFVSKSGSGTECSEAAPCATIALALTTSRAAPGTGDEIRVGAGLYVERVPINDESDAGLTLRGAGRGPDQTATPEGATTIRAAEDNKNNVIEIKKASEVTVEDLRVEVPSGFVNTAGVELDAPEATLRDDHLQSAGFINTEAIWVNNTGSDANILGTRVRMLENIRGVAIFGPRTTIADSDLKAAGQQPLDVENASSSGTRVLRSRIEAGEGHVVTLLNAPEVAIDSSLIVGGSIGVSAFANFGGVSLVMLSNDTVDVDVPKSGKSGEDVNARTESVGTASVSLVNSIALEKQKVEGEGASVTCKSSIAPPQGEASSEGLVECGPEAGNLAPAPGSLFVAGVDWHLRPGSPAIDSGSGEDTLTATDLDGAPRVADGDGDGTAVIDRGAFELPPPAPEGPVGQQPPSSRFNFGKLRRNRRKGTATLQVRVPGPGRLVIFGKQVRRFALDVPAAGSFGLKIVARKGVARKLREKGNAHVSFKVTFIPTGGTANTKMARRKLIRRRAH
jgi:hypothetical protein